MAEVQFFKQEFHDIVEPRDQLGAVIRLHAALKLANQQPDSDDWISNRAWFLAHAKPLILQYWSEATGFAPQFCPMTDDWMAGVLVSWRKASLDVQERAKAACQAHRQGFFDNLDSLSIPTRKVPPGKRR